MADELSREQLEDQVTLLEEQLKALKGSSRELGVLMSLRMGMTSRLAEILFILVNRSPASISQEKFHFIFYGARADGGPEPKIFAVHISRLRSILRRLKAPGQIDTVWNAGYRANPELVNWVKQLYADQIPQEE